MGKNGRFIASLLALKHRRAVVVAIHHMGRHHDIEIGLAAVAVLGLEQFPQ